MEWCVVCVQDPVRQQFPCDLLVPSALSSTSSPSEVVPLPDAHTFESYFERQVLHQCGLHALNNAIGASLLNTDDMVEACTEYLAEMLREGCREKRSDHELPTGWYSEAVMSFVLRWKIAKHELGSGAQLKLDLDSPVQSDPTSAARIYASNCLGVIVNKHQSHWVAFKIQNNQLWLLDSCEEPLQMSFQEYVEVLRAYRNAFAVIDDA